MPKKVHSFRLSDEAHEALIKAAEKDKRSASDFLELLLRKVFKVK